MGLRAQAGETGALTNAHSCLPIALCPSIPLPPSATWEASAGPGAPLRLWWFAPGHLPIFP